MAEKVEEEEEEERGPAEGKEAAAG